MEKMEEIVIIHTKEDYAQSVYFRGFIKWIGLSYFDFVFNEQNETLNEKLEEKIKNSCTKIYINDRDKRWKNQYTKTGEKSFSIKMQKDELWKDGKLESEYLSEVFKGFEAEETNLWNHMIRIYCTNNLMSKLVSNTQTTYIGDYEEARKIWEKVISKLKNIMDSDTQSLETGFLKYVKYAYVYSKQKLNELCGLYKKTPPYETQELLKDVDSTYFLDANMYALENLKSKIAASDIMYRVRSVSFLINCTQRCPLELSNSFYYYRLGKQYEINLYMAQSMNAYRTAYRKNELNFRALFKLAVECMKSEDWDGEREYLDRILKILQLDIIKDNSEKYMKYLPPLELEYAEKCYILLGNMEKDAYSNIPEAEKFYKMAQKVYDTIKENVFLKTIYTDEEQYKGAVEFYKGRLSKEEIGKKINRLNL